MTTTPENFDAKRDAATRAARDKKLSLPNFAALREWIDKLEDWCRDTAEDLEKEEKRVEQMEETVSKAEQEASEGADAVQSLEAMEEALEDVERGVTTFAEFMEKRRREALY